MYAKITKGAYRYSNKRISLQQIQKLTLNLVCEC